MNIEAFINNFEDVIPYQFKIKIGGSRINGVKKDKNKINSKNFKGKVYPVYRVGIMETTTEWLPMEEMKLPIDIAIECDYPHRLLFEKRSKHTKEDFIRFEVRLLHEKEDRQFGFISLDLNPAGDITDKFCAYYNADGTHKIIQSICYFYNEKTKEVVTNENLSYIFRNIETETEEKVEFYKQNGILEGITINDEKLRNHAYDSIVWSEEDIERQMYMYARCYSKNLLNGEEINCDTANHIINNDFTFKRKKIKELQHLLEHEKEEKYQHTFDYRRFKEELKWLLDLKNDSFRGFVGQYIGNTIIQEAGKLMLIVETIKDGLHYFTGIDITNTGAFNVDICGEREDDEAYFSAIRNASKYPLFRLKIENGIETLVPFNGEPTEIELANYNKFKSHCSESFTTLTDKRLITLSLKKRTKK